jgi:hypothetical protein
MTIERWELLPSSKPDRYILKIRGEKAAVDKIVQMYERVCQPPRELADDVYQWAVTVTEATLNERLSIQDSLREMVSRPPEEAASAAFSVDLSGVLAELNMVLEGLTGLTADEQARVAQKMQEIQQREVSAPSPAASLAPPEVQAPPAPPAVEAPVPPSPVSSSPSAESPGRKETAIPEKPPVPDTEKPVVSAAAGPAGAAEPAPAKTPSSPVSPASVREISAAVTAEELPADLKDVPPDQILRAAFFLPSDGQPLKDKFLNKLSEMSRQKAKKPIFIHSVLSRATAVSNEQAPSWIQMTKSVNADCFFVILPSQIPAEFLDESVTAARQAGLFCFLIPPSEIESRLLYVDLMVELMFVKRKK